MDKITLIKKGINELLEEKIKLTKKIMKCENVLKKHKKRWEYFEYLISTYNSLDLVKIKKQTIMKDVFMNLVDSDKISEKKAIIALSLKIEIKDKMDEINNKLMSYERLITNEIKGAKHLIEIAGTFREKEKW